MVGASLLVAAPTGQYYPNKLINLGTNRWAAKPEVALSYPLGPRWLLDAYAGVWLAVGQEPNVWVGQRIQLDSNDNRSSGMLIALGLILLLISLRMVLAEDMRHEPAGGPRV